MTYIAGFLHWFNIWFWVVNIFASGVLTGTTLMMLANRAFEQTPPVLGLVEMRRQIAIFSIVGIVLNLIVGIAVGVFFR